MTRGDKFLSRPEHDALIDALKARFEAHMARHTGAEWAHVAKRLAGNPERLRSLFEMERSGGEPDVVGIDDASGAVHFIDCSPESPSGRRSLCYDRQALDARKEAKPAGNAIDAAAAMGTNLLTEAQYRALQNLGRFDSKTSSWLMTPPAVRRLGGALFGDFRYGTVFVYHNGAQSYYAVRGFRTALSV